jgi:enterochelin esterase-like enzyme
MKFTTILLLITISMNPINAQNMGKTIESNAIYSNILKRPVKYSIYLPADYNTSERTYPVVYLLHGLFGNETDWIQQGEINRLADKAITDGTIPPMIIIMPDNGNEWYVNTYDGKSNYEDFFVKELIPTIDSSLRTKTARRFRALAGLSMGGYGSMLYALHHPDLFSAAAGLSSWIKNDELLQSKDLDDWWKTYLGPSFGRDLYGKDRITAHWHQNSIFNLVETKPTEDLKKLRYWLDCGDEDQHIKGNSLLYLAFKDKKIPMEYRVRDGGHTWQYWRTGIIDALKFIGDGFH